MSDAPTALTPAPDGYAEWLADLKRRIGAAQQRATLAVNRERWHLCSRSLHNRPGH